LIVGTSIAGVVRFKGTTWEKIPLPNEADPEFSWKFIG
jgi:hypothetical protein